MSEFRSWEELTVVEQLQSEYSDFYKEVYGFRPRGMATEHWNSEEWLNAAIADLAEASKAVFAEEERRQQEAIREFKELVEFTIANGARTYENAIRWIADGANVDGDMEHLCWIYGLPFGYFKEGK